MITQRHGIIQVAIDEIPGVVQSFSHTRLSFDILGIISFRFMRRLHQMTCQVLEMQQQDKFGEVEGGKTPIASTRDSRSVRLKAIDIASSFFRAREYEV